MSPHNHIEDFSEMKTIIHFEILDKIPLTLS